MRRRNRRGGAIALALLVFALAGCTQKVTAKECSGGKCTITYSQYKENGEKIKDRTLAVSRETFEHCAIGEKWPDCDRQLRTGQRNIPLDDDGKASADREPELNQPREKRDADRKDRNPKLVCVKSIALHRIDVTNTWTIGSEQRVKEKIRNQGEFERCRNAQPGDEAKLTAEHHSEPGMIQCTISVDKKIVDYMHVQEMADCKVAATVK